MTQLIYFNLKLYLNLEANNFFKRNKAEIPLWNKYYYLFPVGKIVYLNLMKNKILSILTVIAMKIHLKKFNIMKKRNRILNLNFSNWFNRQIVLKSWSKKRLKIRVNQKRGRIQKRRSLNIFQKIWINLKMNQLKIFNTPPNQIKIMIIIMG